MMVPLCVFEPALTVTTQPETTALVAAFLMLPATAPVLASLFLMSSTTGVINSGIKPMFLK
jgi:hypothetical protein